MNGLKVILYLSFWLLLSSSSNESFAKTINETDSLKRLLSKDIEPEQRVEALILLGNRYQTVSLDSALLYSNTALTIANDESFQDSVFIHIHNLLGRTYMKKGLYDKAISNYLEGIKIAENLDDKTLYAKLLINMSIVYFHLADFDRSESILLEAIDIIQEYSSDNEFPNKHSYLSSVYNNLAIIYEHKRDTIKLMSYYDTALMHSTAINDDRNIALILNNVGNIQLNQRKFDDAYKNIITSLNMRIDQNDIKGQVQNYDNLGRYYLKMSKWDSAIYYFKKGLATSKLVGGLTDIISLHKGLEEVYERTGQFDKALTEQKYYTALNDSLYNLQRAMEIAKIEASYEFEQQQALHQMEEKKRTFRFYLILSIVFCITVIAAIWMIFHLKFQKKSLEGEHQKLSLSLEHKNKEMATNVLYQFKKNELINKVILQLKELFDTVNTEQKVTIQRVIKGLEEGAKDEAWAEFEILFNETHQNFYKTLEQEYPDLTPNERRLCAFLKLNMTSKEISALTGQSVRSIVVARSRLRKKLNLTNVHTNLIDFLASV